MGYFIIFVSFVAIFFIGFYLGKEFGYKNPLEVQTVDEAQAILDLIGQQKQIKINMHRLRVIVAMCVYNEVYYDRKH